MNQQIEKIKALLLNKVKGIRWNYFNLEAGKMNFIKNEEPDSKWFDNIIMESGGWKWQGDAPESNEIMKQLVNAINKDPSILFVAMTDIYKLKHIPYNSDADEGVMGALNRQNSEARNRLFLDKMKKGFRSKEGNMVILAEGDSWFQFPRIAVAGIPVRDFVRDIGDHLGNRKDIAWYNLAYAGDWLSNMLYDGRYVTELDNVEPHVFLISGGGNDMVGGKRIKTFVKAAQPKPHKVDSLLLQQLLNFRQYTKSNQHSTFNQNKYSLGLSWIQDGFIDFLNCIYIQYLSLFVRVYKNTDKFRNLLTITQGYDYVLPSDDNARGIEVGHSLVNKFIGNGKWLKFPMTEKGILKSADQEAILYTMIFEFNELMLDFARADNFPNVAHIDSRGLASNKNDWFDELHLESEIFKKVADKFYTCIDHFRKNNGVLKKSIF